jgi:hypothetical protein
VSSVRDSPLFPTIPRAYESVTKFVPSAKADSVGSTSDYPALRAGLSHAAAKRLEIRFVPPLVDNTEFRNRLLRPGLNCFAAVRLE